MSAERREQLIVGMATSVPVVSIVTLIAWSLGDVCSARLQRTAAQNPR